MAKNNSVATFEQKLWEVADKLRKNINAAEYKHVVFGFVFFPVDGVNLYLLIKKK